MAGEQDGDPGNAFARALYADVLGWARTADSKAHLVLTTNGAFLTILAAVVLSNPEHVVVLVGTFGPETWFFLAAMALSLLATSGSAILVLYSRVRSNQEVAEILRSQSVDVEDGTTYVPATLWFFQFLALLKSDQLGVRLARIAPGDGLEAKVLANESVQLSKRVVQKHIWLNRAFVLSAVTLTCLLLAGVSYVVRVALTP